MTGRSRGAWVLVAPPALVEPFAPLVEAHGRDRPVVVHERTTVPDPDEWPSLLGPGAAGALLVADRRRSPRSALPGVFVRGSDGAAVPVGWVPAGAGGVAQLVATALAVRRRTDTGPLAVLGQRSARYQRLSERLEHHLHSAPSVRWGAERVTREDLCTALEAGLGAAVYLGHGRPSGWAAYRGLRAAHLAGLARRPLGCVLSVTCWTASRWRVGTSFSEQLVLQGSAAATVGATRPVEHLASTRVVVALAAAVRSDPPDVATLLRRTLLVGGKPTPEARDLRLCGDPLASLAAEHGATARAAAVFAPPPDLRPQDRHHRTEEVA
ncbi:C25 family cysteine peptidase [Nocardioides caldifontis]|uniref:C25 family cysteine peptidase n=1 Tax=Nocardioides caldifontis TaxID=2588938 RepID=UPI0011E01381|nr:C25 family cysteine peptidase [Nocardioides caldifontis]